MCPQNRNEISWKAATLKTESRWEDDTEKDLIGTASEDVKWTRLAKDRVQWLV
jgi:hypothetical protein